MKVSAWVENCLAEENAHFAARRTRRQKESAFAIRAVLCLRAEVAEPSTCRYMAANATIHGNGAESLSLTWHGDLQRLR
jgi:hypothetical protein